MLFPDSAPPSPYLNPGSILDPSIHDSHGQWAWTPSVVFKLLKFELFTALEQWRDDLITNQPSFIYTKCTNKIIMCLLLIEVGSTVVKCSRLVHGVAGSNLPANSFCLKAPLVNGISIYDPFWRIASLLISLTSWNPYIKFLKYTCTTLYF